MNKNKTILFVLQIGKNQEYTRPLFPAMFFYQRLSQDLLLIANTFTNGVMSGKMDLQS